jgi:protein SCO1/2
MRRGGAALLVLLVAGCARAGETLPPFTLSDQAGATVRAEDLRGRPLLVSFIFTTCVEACPIIVAQLVRAQVRARAEGLGDRVRFVSITVDPVTDTPPRLRQYAEGFGVDFATCSFLTGSPAEVARVMRGVGVTAAPGAKGLAHDAPVLFVDAAGRIVERHRGAVLDPEAAVARLRKLTS